MRTENEASQMKRVELVKFLWKNPFLFNLFVGEMFANTQTYKEFMMTKFTLR